MNVLTSIKNMFDINPATLSGAMDIVGVPYEDGNIICSPFHVRFGKDQSISCRHKVIHISVNDKPTDVRMKLGGEGEAYFVFECGDNELLPEDLIASPLASPNTSPYASPAASPRPLDENIDDLLPEGYVKSNNKSNKEETANSLTEFSKLYRNGLPSNPITKQKAHKSVSPSLSCNNLVDKDIQSLHLSPKGNETSDVLESSETLQQSTSPIDGAAEIHSETTPELSPVPTTTELSLSPVPFGINSSMDETVKNRTEFIHNSRSNSIDICTTNSDNNKDISEKNPESSVNTIDVNKKNSSILERDVSTNHCICISKKRRIRNGEDYKYNVDVPFKGYTLIYEFNTSFWDIGFKIDFKNTKGEISELVPYSRVASHITSVYGGILAPEEGTIIFTWDNTYSTFNKKDLLVDIYRIEGPIPPQFSVNVTTVYGKGIMDYCRNDGFIHVILPYKAYALIHMPDIISLEVFKNEQGENTPPASPKYPSISQSDSPVTSPDPLPSLVLSLCKSKITPDLSAIQRQTIMTKYQISFTDIHNSPGLLTDPELYITLDGKETTLDNAQEVIIKMAQEIQNNPRFVHSVKGLKKSLRPSPEMLASFPLHMGKNKITFTIHGDIKRSLTSYFYLWTPDSKIIISDIDGTITRSDVMGHIMYALNRDWTQKNIAQLYDKIHNNGYMFLYLTARAVGQMKSTRNYIEHIDQHGYKMPDGPIISSPDRIMASLMREVVLRKPQEFKVPALASIRNIFPSNYNPFYCGFGNRPTDLFSYIEVGLPSERVYITDKVGILTCTKDKDDNITSSFTDLFADVDNVFPPFSKGTRQNAMEQLSDKE